MTVRGTKERLAIGSAKSKPGGKVSGRLKVADKAFSSLELPVSIIQGKSPGPTLALIAGEHGCEYCGIVAAVRIIRDISPSAIKGTLVVVPLANPPAFEDRTLFVNPIDYVNVYSSYPGSPDGTASYKMAHAIFNEVALKADYVIHLHGADYNEELFPFNYYAKSGNEHVDAVSRKMASCFPVDYVLESIVAEESSVGSPKGTTYAATAKGTLYGEVSSRGIPATMCESGREGKVEEELVKVHYEGVRNVMKLIGMLPGNPTLRKMQSKLYGPVLVNNTRPGLFNPIVKVGQSVSEREKIAEILDFEGNVVESIRSPISGIVVDRINFAAADAFPTQKQPYLFYIAKVVEARARLTGKPETDIDVGRPN
jgi:predicted deacylase